MMAGALYCSLAGILSCLPLGPLSPPVNQAFPSPQKTSNVSFGLLELELHHMAVNIASVIFFLQRQKI